MLTKLSDESITQLAALLSAEFTSQSPFLHQGSQFPLFILYVLRHSAESRIAAQHYRQLVVHGERYLSNCKQSVGQSRQSSCWWFPPGQSKDRK